MTVAIDYDDTWTADAKLWTAFYWMAKAAGHDVIVVSGRPQSQCPDRKLLPACAEVICTGGEPKRKFVESSGLVKVDIWIDDRPGSIESSMFLHDDEKL